MENVLFFYMLIPFILIAQILLFPVLSGYLASQRNRSILLWTLIGLFLGPIGWIVGFLEKVDLQEEADNHIIAIKNNIKKTVNQQQINFDDFIKIAELYKQGFITDEEYQKQKQKYGLA